MNKVNTGTLGTSPTRYRWYVMGLIFVVYVVAAADRANIGIVLPYIRDEFQLTNTGAGLVASLFFFFYAFGQVPAAFLIKKFGARKVLPISLGLTSLATGLHGVVGSKSALYAVRGLLGASEAPIALSSVTSINNWFPAKEKGFASGLFVAAAKTGPVLVPPIGALIILYFGWQYVFFFFALPGFLLMWFWLFLVPDKPANSQFVNAAEAKIIEDKENPKPDVDTKELVISDGDQRFKWLDRLIRTARVNKITNSLGVFKSWNNWGAAFGYFLFVGTMSVILSWLPTYLKDVKGFDILGIGFVAAAPFAGSVLGTTFGGWFSDNVLDRRRKPLMILSCLSTVVMMLLLRSAPNNAVALSGLLFATGLFLSLGFSLFSIYAAALCDRSTFPVATAVINTCGQFGGATMPLFTGILLDAYDWDAVFIGLACAAAIAFVFLMSIVEPRGFKEDLVNSR